MTKPYKGHSDAPWPERPAGTPWTQALGSVKFELINPTSAMIDWGTVATIMARVARYNGHTEGGIYSDAQHTREGAYAILRDTVTRKCPGGRRDWAAAFALHDVHEYVIGDLTIPVLDAICYHAVLVSGDLGADRVVREALKSLKANIDVAVHAAAGIPWPLDSQTRAIVKEYDIRMLRTERDARIAPPPEPWAERYEKAAPVLGVDLSPLSEECAAARFREMCEDLLPACQHRTIAGGTGAAIARPEFIGVSG